MASNGVILLNLNNRNAADFQRLEVPDSYEKASGALTAGTYVTVYKWLYQGFMMAPSLCDAVGADDHINLVDRSNGGILEVYPDDTIKIQTDHTPDPDPEPEPEPVPAATRVWTHSTGGNDASLYMQAGTYENGVFVPSGEAIDVLYRNASNWVEHGIVQVRYGASWSVRGVVSVQLDGTPYPAEQTITSWSYGTSVDYLFIETPSEYNGYRIRLGHLTNFAWYVPFIIIRQANVVNGVEHSIGGDNISFRPALSFSIEGNQYTASFYEEYNQGEFGMIISYVGSGLVNVHLYSSVTGLKYCQVPQSGSPVISDLPDRSSSTVTFDIPSEQDWIDILIWRNAQ